MESWTKVSTKAREALATRGSKTCFRGRLGASAKTVCEVKKIDKAIDPKQFSSWKNLVRETARIQRLANKIRFRGHTQTGRQGPIVPEKLEKAEPFWIKEAQTSLHSQIKKGEFMSLSDFVDGQGVVRVGGRVDQAVVSYKTRHPELLQSDHWISMIITRYVHQQGHWILKDPKGNEADQLSQVQMWVL